MASPLNCAAQQPAMTCILTLDPASHGVCVSCGSRSPDGADMATNYGRGWFTLLLSGDWEHVLRVDLVTWTGSGASMVWSHWMYPGIRVQSTGLSAHS
jgi:hypothetical protein